MGAAATNRVLSARRPTRRDERLREPSSVRLEPKVESGRSRREGRVPGQPDGTRPPGSRSVPAGDGHEEESLAALRVFR